jgi:hypothetical protein
MDFSLVAQAGSAITLAKEFTKAAVGIRDFNQVAAALSQVNDQLLKAQDALFTHNTQLLELQEQYRQAMDELRKLKDIVAERGRYQLHELSQGVFVYRFAQEQGAAQEGINAVAQPTHYVCQRCFDKGVKSVLIRHDDSWGIRHTCEECGVTHQEIYRNPVIPDSSF